MANENAEENAANEIELDSNQIWYVTDIDLLLAQDPVHAHILDLDVETAITPDVAMFTKINLVKLAATNKAKASNLGNADVAKLFEDRRG